MRVFREKSLKSLVYIILMITSTASAQTPGETSFEAAVAAREAGRLDEAREALQRAADEGVSPVRVGLELARLDVRSGAPDTAVTGLRQLADNGFTAVGLITGDDVLSSLAGRPDFDALVTELSVQAYPCEHDEAFSAFDFWVGEWDVRIASGAIAGTNVITKEQRGCVLVEQWQSASGGSGMSINYLDRSSNEWVQIWNDAGGSQINIRGGMTDRGMLLTGTIHYVAAGTTLPFRGLWTPLEDGRVRQYFEQSNDEGQTWTSWFEGFYTRTGP